jgi:hypothetical protein
MRRKICAGLILLALAGCDGPLMTKNNNTKDVGSHSGDRTTSDAARFLPSFEGQAFQVRSIDFAAWADPMGQALDLIETAMNDKNAPSGISRHQNEPTKTKLNKFRRSTYMAATAVKCLHQTGHLELYGYQDKAYLYSVAVVLVVDARAYADVDVTLCALTDLTGIALSGRERNQPRLSPCVGLRRESSFVVTWIASTDKMCGALGGHDDATTVKAADRDLHRGQNGPDVSSIQFLLNEAGMEIRVDGSFGPSTERAVARFQDCYGGPLPFRTRGVVDEHTKAALRAALADRWIVPDECRS